MKNLFNLILTVVIGITILSCARDIAKPEPIPEQCTPVSFSQEILPIMQQRCTGCHSTSYSCGSLEDYMGVKDKYNNGTLKQRVIVQKDMPSGSSLTQAEIQKINCWIEQGAPNN
jgi:hypothetical protein